MSDLRAGPYRLEEASSDIKLAGPTVRVLAGDGSLVMAASTQGNRVQRGEIEAACDVALAALNDKPAEVPSTNDGLREALEEIMSSDVTNVAVAKEIAGAALGRE